MNSILIKSMAFGGILAGLLACNSDKTTPAEEPAAATVNDNLRQLTPVQFQNMDLSIGQPQSKSIAETIPVSGMVDVPPENIAQVSMPIDGFVKALTHSVLPGKYVAKGSVLARVQSMSAVQLQQDYLEKFSQQEYLNRELERQQLLAADDATSKRKLQEAENNVRVNKATLGALAAKLQIIGISLNKLQSGEVTSYLPVLSPISGFVKSVNVNTGTNFSPADVLFELIATQHLHVELQVFEKDAYKIKEGQTVVFNDPRIGGRVEGKIFLIGKAFENDSRAINVHVHIQDEKAEQRLIPGQILQAQILTDARTARVLPESAVLKEGDGSYVFVLKNKSDKGYEFERIPVETGATEDGMIEILNPSVLNDVVTSHVTFLNGIGEEGQEE